MPESPTSPAAAADPCQAGALRLPGPVGVLEAQLGCPAAARPPRAVAVICHPHPLHGGSLHNKVVDTLARTCQGLEVASLRFNFRGVGASAGDYADGLGEAEDLRAVLAWAQRRWPNLPLWLAGFSFGAYVALRVAHEVPLARLITVAPPINFFDFSDLQAPACPWILIQGEADEIVPADQVLVWAERQRPSPEILRMPGVGHFFHGQLNGLREALTDRLAAL